MSIKHNTFDMLNKQCNNVLNYVSGKHWLFIHNALGVDKEFFWEQFEGFKKNEVDTLCFEALINDQWSQLMIAALDAVVTLRWKRVSLASCLL